MLFRSHAPLNSRAISNAKVKGKGKQEPLDRVPLEIQEAMILEDLLFVLMVPPFISCLPGIDLICRHVGH